MPDASLDVTSSPRAMAASIDSLRAHPGVVAALRGAATLERVGGGFRPVAGADSPRAGWSRAERRLEITLPSSPDAALRVAVAGDAKAYVEIRGEDLAPVEPTLDERMVVFSRASLDMDVVHMASATRFEELRVLHGAHARTTHRWALRLGPAFAGVRVKDGRIEVVDAAGSVQLTTDPIVATDAKGALRTLDLKSEKVGDTTTVSASLDASGLAWPIVVDPAWTALGNTMTATRMGAASGLLPDGTLVVAGGLSGGGITSTAEVWNPTSGAWTALPSMLQPHYASQGFVLSATGTKFLVVDHFAGKSELWNGTSWTSYPMVGTHSQGMAVFMGGTVNKVLVSGGGGPPYLSTAEVFDGTSWKAAAPMLTTRATHTGAWLPNVGTVGRVLIAGGTFGTPTPTDAEFYDPATNSWSAAPAGPSDGSSGASLSYSGAPAITLPNGNALFINANSDGAYVFDTTTGWSPTYTGAANLFGEPAVRLSGGKVLWPPYLFDSTTKTWANGGPMVTQRSGFAFAALSGNRAIAAGGWIGNPNSPTEIDSVELYAPVSNGGTCTVGGECVSGICTDGRCCDAACASPCQACDVSSSLGTCTNVTGVPHGSRTCSGYVCSGSSAACPTSCSTDANCTSTYWCKAGLCVAKSAQGAACPSGNHECSNGTCVDGYCCNAACTAGCGACDLSGKLGTCSAVTGSPHGTRTCGTYGCLASLGTSCPTSCNATTYGDTQCLSGFFCNGSPGACVAQKSVGQACPTGNHECTNGTCVDGYCCNAACAGSCQACDATSSLGTCTNVSGAPHGTRTACASNLVCQGLGAACPTTCTGDSGCATGFWCSGGACVAPKANGQQCPTGAHECQSGNCVDGYCCNAPCGGQCEACDVGGALGTCTAVSGAPHSGRTKCGGSGFCGAQCDGSTRTTCGPYPGLSTVCAAASCGSGSATPTRYCDGSGSCVSAASSACAPYVCNGTTSCKTNCSSDLDCASSYHCSGTTCVTNGTLGTYCSSGTQCSSGLCTNNACCTTATCAAGLVCNANGLGTCSKPLGNTCSGDAECGSGKCVDGVCCNAPCTGTCEACNVGGSLGTCVPVAGAPRSGHGSCAGTGTCQATCDGANRTACGSFPGTTTVCAAAVCTGSTATPARYCDGLGACATIATVNCAPYTCGGTSCRASCSLDSDCVSGDFCNGSTCTAKLALGATCSLPTQCQSGNCVDGSCCSSASCAAPTKCNVPGATGSCSKPNGTSCAAASECGSGNCVDSVCCNAACNGTCEACNVGGSSGTCVPVAGAPKPGHGTCPGTGACGASCDGSTRNACGAFPGTTTVCAAASCSGGSASPTQYCDGLGACAAASAAQCLPYVCGGSACKTSCGTTAGDCASGYACKGGVCVTTGELGTICTDGTQCKSGSCTASSGGKSVCCSSATCTGGTVCADTSAGALAGSCLANVGNTCTGAGDCLSGFCVDGFCCESLCSGQCEACDVPGAVGKCTGINGPPHTGRAACSDGKGDLCKALACDGSKDRTKCVSFANGPDKQCKAPSCADGNETLASFCDGVGGCTAGATRSCGGNYACGDTTCLTKCAKDGDCAIGFGCDTASGKCVPQKPTCTADGLSTTSSDGQTTTQCAPFRCDPSAGNCYGSCSSTDQCVPGSVCDGAKCVAGPGATADSGGCDAGGGVPARGASGAVALAAVALAFLRRRRAA